MTLNEFKAWLDGFADAMGDAPTPEQWAKIKAKLADVHTDWTGGLGARPAPGADRAGALPHWIVRNGMPGPSLGDAIKASAGCAGEWAEAAE